MRMEMGQRGISSPVYVQGGISLWSSPAAAADVAIEQLTKIRHKRIHATHIFIVPRRWIYLCRRKLYHSYDVRFNIKPGVSFWKILDMDLLLLLFSLLFVDTSRGNLEEFPFFWNWQGRYSVCSKKMNRMHGVCCANFSSAREN